MPDSGSAAVPRVQLKTRLSAALVAPSSVGVLGAPVGPVSVDDLVDVGGHRAARGGDGVDQHRVRRAVVAGERRVRPRAERLAGHVVVAGVRAAGRPRSAPGRRPPSGAGACGPCRSCRTGSRSTRRSSRASTCQMSRPSVGYVMSLPVRVRFCTMKYSANGWLVAPFEKMHGVAEGARRAQGDGVEAAGDHGRRDPVEQELAEAVVVAPVAVHHVEAADAAVAARRCRRSRSSPAGRGRGRSRGSRRSG